MWIASEQRSAGCLPMLSIIIYCIIHITRSSCVLFQWGTVDTADAHSSFDNFMALGIISRVQAFIISFYFPAIRLYAFFNQDRQMQDPSTCEFLTCSTNTVQYLDVFICFSCLSLNDRAFIAFVLLALQIMTFSCDLFHDLPWLEMWLGRSRNQSPSSLFWFQTWVFDYRTLLISNRPERLSMIG